MSEKLGVVEVMGGGIKRQILAYNDDAMAVKVWFEKGAEGYAHTHPHTQIVYCEEGEFNFVIDGKLKVLKAGDSCVINPHVEHGTTTETGGILIDMFSPMREDFL